MSKQNVFISFIFLRIALIMNTPFSKLNCANGLVAQETVNADDAQRVGTQILTPMVRHSVTDFKFTQKNQVKTLASAKASASGE